jgi:NAD(P)-dependent dehydrogenase (short-subunit alcohol dehydrogenase family)
MTKPVCVVVGVGPGNGAAFARRFSAEGYATALLSRSTEFAGELAATLADSRAYACDVKDDSSIQRAFAAIRTDLGEVEVLIYNAGSGVWGSAEEISTAQLEEALRVNAVGLLACSQAAIPAMKARAKGAIVVIGATASRRGGAKTAAFAPAKAAQRSLSESLARHLGPLGIHVCLIIIDGVVDLPRTRQRMPDKPDGFFVKPEDVADSALWLTRQPRSAWAFEVEARPFGEAW